MVRVIATAAALLALAASATGCGGSSLQSIVRHDSDQTWGEPNPRILSVESVHLANGAAANVVRLRGNFRFDSAGCACVSRTNYAVL